VFYYYLISMEKSKKKGKIIAKYGCEKSALSHKKRLESDLKWKNLEVHMSTKNLVKNQILDVSSLN